MAAMNLKLLLQINVFIKTCLGSIMHLNIYNLHTKYQYHGSGTRIVSRVAFLINVGRQGSRKPLKILLFDSSILKTYTWIPNSLS